MGGKIINQKTLFLACKWINCILAVTLFVCLFILPGVTVIKYLSDPALQKNDIPQIALQTHRSLTSRYGLWLKQRIESKKAAQLSTHNISGTEWPLFGTVFYLWATEAIQQELTSKGVNAKLLPSAYAKDTLKLSAQFLVDPNQAKWVKDHWGNNYLSRENLFYRMLLIGGLFSYQNILNDKTYEPILREQAISLARELDASPYGLLDDYPGQCYPIDIIAAIAAIKRADVVLKTDHSLFVERAVRAFQAARLDPQTLLPAYNVDSKTGVAFSGARGIGLSFMLIWAPELWKDVAVDWYAKYKHFYWQERYGIVGFREFSNYSKSPDWWMDVDSGPVMAGFGIASTAFGLGAAKANNHINDAQILSSEIIPLSWPLWDGTLLGARLLSNVTDAPYLGEMALLFLFTRQPMIEKEFHSSASMPLIVYFVTALYFLVGTFYIYREIRELRKWVQNIHKVVIMAFWVQITLWLAFLLLGLWLIFFKNIIFGVLACLGAGVLPLVKFRL